MDQKCNLTAAKRLDIRFSEVDSMSIAWHGSYPLYFEDAREEFGRLYGLGYMCIFDNGYYAPLVELSFKYKKPITYRMHPIIEIRYVPTDAAKIHFKYTIKSETDGEVLATGESVQVFTDRNNELVWYNPPFYEAWKKKWLER
jgi:acyl-CoA thioester hydrolase